MRSDINVTPLVDIVLVLLIIFIVITPAVDASVKLPLAKHSPKVEKEPGAKYITVVYQSKKDANGKYVGPGPISIDEKDAQGQLFVLDGGAKEQALSDFINRNVSYLMDKRVFVKADGDMPYSEVDKLFKLIKKSGADEASIVTGEDKDTKKEGGK
ncbi:MAG TPA: biopolymer transporter ExbD [Holophagaceae bacterium]|nr:biopolymer transporter ExbD [Holophagaceae bacterium]